MYDPIFAKSFSRYDRRRFGCFAFIVSLFIALSICSTFKPTLHPLTLIGDAVSLHLSINAVEDMLIDDVIITNPSQTVSYSAENAHETANTSGVESSDTRNIVTMNESERNRPLSEESMQNVEQSNPQTMVVVVNELERNGSDGSMQNVEESERDRRVMDGSMGNPHVEAILNPEKIVMVKEGEGSENMQKVEEPLCRVLKSDADYCQMVGDVRVHPNSSTIFLINPTNALSTSSWIIEPYPRRGTGFVKKWTVKLASPDDSTVPKCGDFHSQPALLFSIGGFSGNHFHDFADLLFPLFTTSFSFNGHVNFLATDYKSWWPGKYLPLLRRLSRHAILDIDHQTTTHCYGKLIAGLNYHRELVAEPSSAPTMQQFRQLLRRTYSLERNKVSLLPKVRPRLMIVSRKRTRILTNEERISRAAAKVGFEVVSAEGEVSANLTKFAQLVNTCDVMVGVHGAGLTNMVFLPEKAVVVQIVPLGGIGVFARLDFGNPSVGMKIRYLEYEIEAKESSLLDKYGVDDPVVRDPMSVHRQGWGKLREVYLNNQNVTIDVRRFRPTLAMAIKLLRRR